MSEQLEGLERIEVQQRYKEALETFVERVKQDRYIIAAIVFGSFAYDEVWEKSDLDMMLVSRDDKNTNKFFTLVENGVHFHVDLVPRSKFKARIERALAGSFTHSIMTRSTLLFSTDETIQEYYENVRHLGSIDREMQLLRAASYIVSVLTKAEKWLVVKQDPTYSALWLMFGLNNLATIEVLWHNDIPGREVIQQALVYNPTFFGFFYHDFIHQPKDMARTQQALNMFHAYLDERLPVLFKPLLNYLLEAGGARSASDINDYFLKRAQDSTIALACEWLAGKGIIRQVSTPVRLTEKSRVTVNEAAYYYDGGESDDTH